MKPNLQRRVQRYGWDRAVDDYEAAWRDQLDPAQTRMLEMAAIQAGDRVLDVACGTGLVTFRAAVSIGSSGRVVGTDISGRMIEAARELADRNGHSQVEFQRCDAESLLVDDESFDVALSALGLMYVPDPDQALTEMRRALVPGGRAAAAVWGQRNRCGWADIFPIVDARVRSEVCPMFFHLGTGDALGEAFRRAGFDQVHTSRITTTLHYHTKDEALAAAFAGGPVALAYSRFDESTRNEAHAEYLQSIEPYRNGNRYALPGEFVVVSGRT
jgi:ubiquinone/menaquinone biosynthesis C-methylase UbiE